MSLGERIKRIAKFLLPPIVIESRRDVLRRLEKKQPALEYAPAGWKTVLPQTTNVGWNSTHAVDTERARWEAFCANLQGPGPLGFSHEHEDQSEVRSVKLHNIHITYAYVLARAAHQKTTVSVLDWGGSLGHYYLLGKAVLPDVTLDFHCKEVPLTAEAGKQLNPDVHFYADESCLARTYDLVMITSSLEYIEDWADTLRRIVSVAKEYLFLMELPVVDHGPGFVAIQRRYGTWMLHEQYNQGALLQVVEGMGLRMVREFVTGHRPYIKNAPEQCELRSWLFRKESQ